MRVSSLLGVFTLLDGELDRAQIAFAATVFDLARKGFITLTQGDTAVREVIVKRTRKHDVLEVGNRTVLERLFGGQADQAGAVVTIKSPELVVQRAKKTGDTQELKTLRRIYGAQSTMNLVQAALLDHNFIKRVRPLQYVRKWLAQLAAVLIVLCVLVVLFTREIEWGFVALAGSMLTYILVRVVLTPYARRRFCLTSHGYLVASAMRHSLGVSDNARISPEKLRELALFDLVNVTGAPAWWPGLWTPGVINHMFNTIAESSKQTPTRDRHQAANNPAFYLQDPYDKPNFGLSKN